VFWVCTIVDWAEPDAIRYFGDAASNNAVKARGQGTIRSYLITVGHGRMRQEIIVVDDINIHPGVGPEDVETKRPE
jgi:hypothetical protein